MNPLLPPAKDSSAQPFDQATPTYSELYDLECAFFDANTEASRAGKRHSDAHAKWAQPVVRAALCADAFIDSNQGFSMYMDLGKAIKANSDAWEAAYSHLHNGTEEWDAYAQAFGFGMIAGLMYSALTGTTLTPSALSMDQLIDQLKSKLALADLPEEDEDAEATPDAPQVD